MTRGVDDGVVPLVGEELLGGARNGHTTLTLFLLAIHVKGESERRLTERIGLSLELFEFALRDTPELEQESTGGGRLAGIDVTADDDGKVFLTLRHCD